MLSTVKEMIASCCDLPAGSDRERLLGPMAGMLLIAAGGLSVLIALTLPTPAGANVPLLVVTGLAGALFGLLVWRLPWHRWPESYSHSIVIVSFVLIAIGDFASAGSYRFNFFYVAAFTWIGLLHKRGTSLRFIPVFIVAYVAPILLRGDSFAVVAAPFVYTLSLCLLVGEVISWLSEKLQHLERDLGEQRSSQRFRSLVENVSDIIAIVDSDSQLKFVSPSINRVLGYPPDRIVGRNVLASIHPDDRPPFRRFTKELFSDTGKMIAGEFRFRHIDGGYRDLEVLAVNRDSNEHVEGLLFTARDITERKITETRLRNAEQRYRMLIEQIPAMTYIEATTTDDTVWQKPWVSPQSETMLGYTASDWANGIDIEKELVHPDDLGRVRAHDDLSEETGQPFECEYRIVAKDGRTLWVRDYAQLLHHDDGTPLYWQGVMFDVTDQKQLEARLELLAYHDELTGLPNRTMLVREIERIYTNPDIEREGAAVLFLDLDNFKLINDSFGHAVGDQVIEIVARRLKDLVGSDDFIARFGGDEFVVVLSGRDATIMADEFARRVRDAMEAPIHVDGREINVMTSIGIAHTHLGKRVSDDLLRDADVAMYEAKQQGRNRFVTFDDSMQERVIERLMLESELRTAIDESQFRLHFQPIVDLHTGEAMRMEALLRWQHPQRGLLAPPEFMSVAEETGQVIAIGQWVIAEACRQVRRWQDTLGRPAPVICVNLSARQFLHPSLAEDIERTITQSGIDGQLLEFEITESAAMEDPEGAVTTLRKLKALDVLIALDDFGTGYSGLSYLTQFPIDTLKIDQTFVAEISDSPEALAIVRTILAFSKSLGLQTIAEGIETPVQERTLQEMGCQLGQGYLYARPAPAARAAEHVLMRAPATLAESAQQIAAG